MVVKTYRVPEYSSESASDWRMVAQHSLPRLSPVACKVYLNLINGLPGPGPARLNGHPIGDWMKAWGISSRGRVYKALDELEAHHLIARRRSYGKTLEGTNLEVLNPPKHMPQEVFDFELENLEGNKQRLEEQQQALETQRAEYQVFLLEVEAAERQAETNVSIGAEYTLVPEIAAGDRAALPAPMTGEPTDSSEQFDDTAAVTSVDVDTVTEVDEPAPEPTVVTMVDESNDEPLPAPAAVNDANEDVAAPRPAAALEAAMSRMWATVAAEKPWLNVDQGRPSAGNQANARSRGRSR